MSAIGDSDAVKIDGRVLAQHQAALTLLQGRLSMPGVDRLSWLDLACGRGQILVGLDQSLSSEARGKVAYYAYDVNQKFTREASREADQLGFAEMQVKVGDLADFDRVLAPEARFDFITLTNAIHEIPPEELASLLVGAIRRLSERGIVFIYDMEQVEPLELGALPWTGIDIRSIARRLLDTLGASDYRPEVGRWQHKTVSGWSIHIHREHLDLSQEEIERRSAEATREIQGEVRGLLERRLDECQASLETLTIHGPQTAQEQEDKVHLLYEYWALSRALGANR